MVRAAIAALALAAFCALFTLLIKLLEAPTPAELVYHWDAPVYLFLAAGLCLGSVAAMRRLLERRPAGGGRRAGNAALLAASGALFVPVGTLLLCLRDEATTDAFRVVTTACLLLVVHLVVASAAIAWLRSADLRRAREAQGQAEQARVEMELRQLRHALSPHFLFNNLNILTAIIDTDPRAAADFSLRLARIYRYLVRHQDADVVTLAEELRFARDYVELLEARFGAAWEFSIAAEPEGAADLLVVPAAIQSLVENAVKHNAGDRQRRLRVRVELEPAHIVVANQRRPLAEPAAGAGTGTGLRALAGRYARLGRAGVEIQAGEQEFVVRLPLIRCAR